MNVQIRPLGTGEVEHAVRLSLLAWAPVFRSFEQVLGSCIYSLIYPDWRASQRAAVERLCGEGEGNSVWVAAVDGTVAGFIVCSMNDAEKVGEVELLAVHPAYQNQGIGTQLNEFALAQMQARGMTLAVTATGGDPGHAPARKAYEKAGYTALPLVRYYQALSDE